MVVQWPRNCDKQLQEQPVTLQIIYCGNNNKEIEEQVNIQQPIDHLKTTTWIRKKQPIDNPIMQQIHLKLCAGTNRKIL